MILKTFEQKYGEYLQETLATYITDKTVIVSNDISFKPFDEDSNCVIAVIQSGNGNRSMMADVTDCLLTMTFICEANYLQSLLLHLNQFIDATSGAVSTLSITQTDNSTRSYLYQIKWKTPTVASAPQDIRTNSNTKVFKVVMCSLQGTVNFTSDIELSPTTFKIKVNGSSILDVPAKVIASYNNVISPQYKPFLLFNYEYPVQVKLASSEIYNLTLLQTSSNRSLLLETAIDYLELSLDGGTTYLPMATFQITSSYSNGIPLITIVMNRGNTGSIDTTGEIANNDDNPGNGLVLL